MIFLKIRSNASLPKSRQRQSWPKDRTEKAIARAIARKRGIYSRDELLLVEKVASGDLKQLALLAKVKKVSPQTLSRIIKRARRVEDIYHVLEQMEFVKVK